MYLNKQNVISALKRMSEFENQLNLLYENFDLSLRENTGRRNMLLSQAQEVFFAKEMSLQGYDVTCSGKTGEPDITLECEEKEIECKLTSASNNSWPLQCDYVTLGKKGSLDFLYVLSDKSFSKFAVLLFENLSIKDFHPPAPGSRQKSRMNKQNAMKKCKVLHGNVSDTGKQFKERYISDLNILIENMKSRSEVLTKRISSGSTRLKKINAQRILENENIAFDRKKTALIKKIKYWSENGPRYKISLEKI